MKKKIGFIDYYINEWHADNYPEWIRQSSGAQGFSYEVAYAWAERNESPYTHMTTGEWCRKNGVEQCATMEELCEKSDVILLLSPDNSENHLRYAEIALRYGKPTYIDKTFAPSLEEAKAIYRLAEQYKTPICSTSALRFATELADCGEGLVSMATTGPGNSFETYAVHQVEMMVRAMGTGAREVTAVQNGRNKSLVYRFADGRRALYHQLTGSDLPFTLSLEWADRVAYRPVQSDFFRGLIDAMLRFYESGEPLAPKEETLAVAAMIEAGVRALGQPDRPVAIAKF